MLYKCFLLLMITAIIGLRYGVLSAGSQMQSSYLHYTSQTAPQWYNSSYREPKWTYSSPVLKNVPSYGTRRFLSFPDGSEFNVTLEFDTPVRGIGSASTFSMKHEIAFRLPTSLDSYVFGRDLPAVQDRLDFYEYFESFLSGVGLEGHSCALRAICEVAASPFDHGLLGEAINHVLSMMGFSEESSPEDEYLRAERHGRHHDSCAALYPRCRLSVTDLISYVI